MFPKKKNRWSKWGFATIAALLLLFWGWDHLVGNVFYTFHGRVVTIDQSPISDASVTVVFSSYDFLQIPMMWKSMASTGYSTVLTTDAKGAFTTGISHGDSIRIVSIAKTGFEDHWINVEEWIFVPGLPPKSSRKDADVRTYVLAPLGPSEGNMEGSIQSKVMYVDGRTYCIDLLAQTLEPAPPISGDLIVSLNGFLGPYERKMGRWDWSVKIQCIGDGEFVETSDPVPMKAPESGYRQEFSLVQQPTHRDFDTKDPGWSRSLSRTFYYRSVRRNLYAWIKLQLNSASPWDRIHEGDYKIYFTYNTIGSPNLFRPQDRKRE